MKLSDELKLLIFILIIILVITAFLVATAFTVSRLNGGQTNSIRGGIPIMEKTRWIAKITRKRAGNVF